MNKLYIGGVEVEVGDILLVKGNRFISYLIRVFMKTYRRKLGLPKETPIYNHAAMIIELWGAWYVAEAMGNGITIRPFVEVYPNRNKDLALLRIKNCYTKAQKIALSEYVCSHAYNPTRYDFFNFVYQIGMIVKTNKSGKKKWNGKTGAAARKRMYCSEAVAWWTNRIHKIFEIPASVNPLDIYINKSLSILHDGQSVKRDS